MPLKQTESVGRQQLPLDLSVVDRQKMLLFARQSCVHTALSVIPVLVAFTPTNAGVGAGSVCSNRGGDAAMTVKNSAASICIFDIKI